jgi:hypothetical protein
MLTNRHVLTAHHCIRDIYASPYASFLPITVTLEKPSPQVDEQAIASNSIEHAQPYGLENLDYAILVLDTPLSLDNVHDGFYRGDYTGSDSSLLNQNVFCAGYGITTLATFSNGVWTGAGNDKLTSSTQIIDDVWSNGTLIRRLHNGIVGAAIDSGSPCFIQSGSKWLVTGTQSNCPDLDWVDFNAPFGQFDWSEATAVRECRGAAPSAFNSMITDNLWTTVNVAYDALPALPPGTVATGTISTSADIIASTDLLNGHRFGAPRSSGIDVDVVSEPAGMMCTRLHATAPMTGGLTLDGRCLSDALVVSMLN